MEITEVRVKLVERSSERLRAFCSITLDGDFVIRDLKIIDGANGAFVAMPSRKLADRCGKCGCKNHLRSKFCNECGQKLNENRAPKDTQGRAKLHADVAHPINAQCRERIQKAVVEAYNKELEMAKSPDYRPTDIDDNDYDIEEEVSAAPAAVAAPAAPAAPAAVPEGSSVNSRNLGNVDNEFSDYNSLIADLKREAADRHTPNRDRTEPSYSQPAASDSGTNESVDNRDAPAPASDIAKPEEKPEKTDHSPAPSPSSPPAPQQAPQKDDDFGAGIL